MATQIFGNLSNYARLAAGNYITGIVATPPPAGMWAAMFSDSANPDDGTPSTEFIVVNYARVAISLADTVGALPITNTGPFGWSGLGAGHLGGLAIMDADTGGNVYAYADTSMDLAEGAVVNVATGAFTIS